MMSKSYLNIVNKIYLDKNYLPNNIVLHSSDSKWKNNFIFI